MKTLRQLQTDAVRIARRKNGTNQFAPTIATEIRGDMAELSADPNNRTKSIKAFVNVLRLLDAQGLTGDDALTMSEQALRIEEMRLNQ